MQILHRALFVPPEERAPSAHGFKPRPAKTRSISGSIQTEISPLEVDDLLSNWAYMVMAALAWNLKSWYGLLTPNRERGLELVKMEFRRFLHTIILLPCQIVRTARRVIYRIVGYNSWLKDFFATWERLQQLVLIE